MKKTTLTLTILLSMLIAANASHAGWVKDFSRKAGKVTRTVTDRGKDRYQKTKSYVDKNKGKWDKQARETYDKTRRTAGEARKGFNEGYNGKRSRW